MYVDDLVIAGTDIDIINKVKRELSARYKMKDLQVVSHLLGCEIRRNRLTGRLTMRQRQYIKDIIARFFADEVLLSISTPADPSIILTKEMCPSSPADIAFMKKIKYREAVGSLLWLALGTRPDICYAVTQVAKFNENPGPQHWEAVKRIFRYLACTLDYAIEYSPVTPSLGTSNLGPSVFHSPSLKDPSVVTPTGYVDSDHARDVDTRRSVTGYIFFLADGPIVWQSRQQTSVALSSMEAEYMSACAATQEAMWLRMVLTELGGVLDRPITLFEDNQACIYLSQNPNDHQKSKHIDRQYHYVREQSIAGTITLTKIPTSGNCSDLLTKPLQKGPFEAHRDFILRKVAA